MKITRVSRNGNDVTGLPWMWSVTDTEVCATNYPHPSITSGQHTNGPASIWTRPIGGEWERSAERSMHKVREMIVDAGKEATR